MAAAAGGAGQTAKRKNGVVVWAGGGGGGLLLLGGGLLAATAALGVAFFVRAVTKRKATTKRFPQGARQEQKRSSAACGGEGVVEQGEEREKIPSVLLPPPPQAALPPPPRQVEENSGSTATAGEAAATAAEFDFGRVEEKVIEESSLVGGRRGGGGEEGPLPAVVNKAMVVNEPKIIQVVGEAPPSAPAGGAGREEDEGSPVADGAEESSGKPGGSSPTAGADNLESHEEVTCPAKATQPTLLPSLEVIRSAKRVAMAMIKGKVFVRAGEKLIRADQEEKMVPWKDSRMQAREMREKGVMDKVAVEILIREKGFFSRNAQMVILVSTVLFTALMAILLHHYSRLPESIQHV